MVSINIVMVVLALTISAFSHIALAEVGKDASCVNEKNNGLCLTIIHGAISTDDLTTFKRMDEPKDFRFLSLDSRGGDVEAAISISRLLRSRGGYRAFVQQGSVCYSACVLLLAGASHRQVEGSVGIHRPYSDTNDKNRSISEIAMEQKRLSAYVKRFLSETNVNSSLYDDMIGIAPHKMKILSRSELERYGLAGDDPVIEQSENEKMANGLGISMQEYLKRKSRMEQCQNRDCASAALYGISVQELMRRRAKAKTLCSGKSNEYDCNSAIIERGE
jgi:hypothetical protein